MVEEVGTSGDEAPPQAPKRWGGRSRILWAGLAVVVLIVISATIAAVGLGGGNEAAADKDTPAADNPQPTEARGKAIFVPIKPPIVVNFKGDAPVRFLQVKMKVLTHDQAAADAIDTYLPIIRNNILLLYSNQDYATLSTNKGKRDLQKQTLSTINQVLKTHAAKAAVDAVYFTSFVMQ